MTWPIKERINKIVESGLYFFIFLLPWQTRWIFSAGWLAGGVWEYGRKSLYVTDILFILILILFFSSRKLSFKKNFTLTYFLLALLVVSLFSLVWASDQALAFYAWLKLVEAFLIFWLVGRIKLDNKKLIYAFLGAAFLQSVLALRQFFTQVIPANKWLGLAAHSPSVLGDSVVETVGGRFLRAYGSLPHPNMLAGFLVVSLILSILLWKKAKSKGERLILLVGLPIVCSGLFFTFSRSAWLALGLALVFGGLATFWQFKEYKTAWLKTMSLVLLVFIIWSVIFSDLVFTRLVPETRLEKKSILERENYFQQSLALIKKYWWRGVGLGNYTLVIHQEVSPGLESWQYQPVHNVYLLILAEISVFGLLIFVLMMKEIFKRLKVIIAQKNFSTLVLTSILVGVFIIFFFDHYFWSLPFGILLWGLVLGWWERSLGKIESP